MFSGKPEELTPGLGMPLGLLFLLFHEPTSPVDGIKNTLQDSRHREQNKQHHGKAGRRNICTATTGILT